MELDRRVAAFSAMGARFPHRAVAPLMLVHRIETLLFSELTESVARYMWEAAKPDNPPTYNWKDFYDAGRVYAVTPAGMIVPKRGSSLEFNAVVRAFAAVMASLNISDLIAAWALPPNVRFKASHQGESVARPHATEKPHTDAWAGESSESVTIHIPILGDTSRNYLALYAPRDDIDPAWLAPRPDYATGTQEILWNYERLAYTIPTGSIALLDAATIHASTLLPGAGFRVSLDARFILKKAEMDTYIHHARVSEYFPDALLHGVGSTHYLHFPDAPHAKVEAGAFQHPSRMRVIELR